MRVGRVLSTSTAMSLLCSVESDDVNLAAVLEWLLWYIIWSWAGWADGYCFIKSDMGLAQKTCLIMGYFNVMHPLPAVPLRRMMKVYVNNSSWHKVNVFISMVVAATDHKKAGQTRSSLLYR